MNEFTPSQSPEKPKSGRMRRVSAIAGAGLFAGLVAAAIGGIASAQTVQVPDLSPETMHNVTNVAFAQGDQPGSDAGGDSDAEHEAGDDLELSAEDEAVFQRFDQCLTDAGISFDDADPEVAEIDEATFDAAYESCEPILDELSDGFEGLEISPEDEAIFEQFDQCLTNAGVDLDADEADVDGSAFDAAFEQCETVLDNLSEEFEASFGDDVGISPEDEAVFEQYDQCLNDAGLDVESEESDLDEAALDAAFETCDPILENLSADAQAMFEDCPEEHSSEEDNEM